MFPAAGNAELLDFKPKLSALYDLSGFQASKIHSSFKRLLNRWSFSRAFSTDAYEKVS